MVSETSETNQDSTTIEQSGQTVEGHQVNIGGDARIDHVGDKISGEVVITGQVDGDVHVTTIQRAPIPAPPPPLQPPAADFFVGREAELAAYGATLDQVGIAVISGMAGMGKTTLASVLARRTARPQKIFWHSFHEGEGVEAVIWRLAGFLAANGREELWALLQNALLSNSRPPPPELLFDYVVEEVRGQNFLLCFDDFQFVGENPLHEQLVEHIRRTLLAGEVKVIITSREMPAFVKLVSFEPLEGLNTADLGQMLAAGDIYLEDEQIAQLHQYTGGNAQMLTLAIDLLQSGYEAEELLTQLVETDDLEDFLMDEVESRLTRNERLAMSAVAILQGYPGSRAAVEAVLDGRRLRRVLRDLSDRFLLTVSRGGEGRHYNQHAIVRDFFYEALNQRERRRMHLRAAEHYRDEEPDMLLAIRHFILGGEHTEAAVLAEEHVYLLLNQGQATALDRLLQQIDRSQLAGRHWIAVRLVSGQVNSFLGQNKQALSSYQEALDALEPMAESAETAGLHARASLGMAEILERQDQNEALSWTEKGLADEQALPTQLTAELTMFRGTLQMRLGDFDQARASFQRALALLPPEAENLRGQILMNLVGLSFHSGEEFEAGITHAAEALAISRRLHDRFQECSVLNNLALIQYTSGDWSGAIDGLNRALALAQELGNQNYVVDFELNLGSSLIDCGDYEQAALHLQDALRVAQDIDHEVVVMEVHTSLAELHIQQQEWDEAAADLALAEALALKLGDRTILPTIYCAWTEIAAAKADIEIADQHARRSMSIASELDSPYDVGIAWRANGLAARAAGRSEEAENCLRQSVQALHELDPFQAARSRLVLGTLLLARAAEIEETRIILSQAKDTFAGLQAAPHLQRTKKALASLDSHEES